MKRLKTFLEPEEVFLRDDFFALDNEFTSNDLPFPDKLAVAPISSSTAAMYNPAIIPTTRKLKSLIANVIITIIPKRRDKYEIRLAAIAILQLLKSKNPGTLEFLLFKVSFST